jgi:pimeloyl-ACP methyl ester carboxylesterase
MSSPAASSDTIVLIHGLGRSRLSLAVIHLWLRSCCYRVVSIGYPSRRISIARAAREHLEPKLAGLRLAPGSRVHFVTHSLGGIVFRAWAETRDAAFPLGRTVMLVPPNQGSEIIDHIQSLRWPRWVLGPVVDELGTHPSHTPKSLGPPPPETGVLMGNKPTLPLFGHMLGAEHDGFVTVGGGRIEGLADFLVLPVDHFTVLFKPCVLRAIRRFLGSGRFS